MQHPEIWETLVPAPQRFEVLRSKAVVKGQRWPLTMTEPNTLILDMLVVTGTIIDEE